MTEELFREDAYARTCAAAVIATTDDGLILDRTVLYCTGGGQPGDTGRLVPADGVALDVVDTIKQQAQIVHRVQTSAPLPAIGTALTAEIDWDRRHRLMRMHSALHLLCAAVACAVTGGQIGEHKSRLDFDIGDATLDKEAICAQLATWIQDDRPIHHSWIDADELERRPELVRTMSVRPPTTAGRVRLVQIDGVDLQACGGTHVRTTGEIGGLTVGKIENKGRRNRRVNLSLAA